MKIDFVLGCGHSGTTLVANILSKNSTVYCPPVETNLMFADRTTDEILFDMQVAAKSLGKHRIVEKTPKHVLYIDKMLSIFPDSKFVIPVRDGRDVAASIKKRTGDLGAGILRWKNEVGIISDYIGNDRFLIYKHEDLVQNFELTINLICDFLNLEFQRPMAEFYLEKTPWFGAPVDAPSDGIGPGEHEKRRSWQVNQPIFDSSGRWQNELDDDDLLKLRVKLMDDVKGKSLMKLFGYI